MVSRQVHPDGLSPNASRISVRLWVEADAAELRCLLGQHLRFIELVDRWIHRPLTLLHIAHRVSVLLDVDPVIVVNDSEPPGHLIPQPDFDPAWVLCDQPEPPLAGREGARMAEADWSIRQAKLSGLHNVDWLFVFNCAAHNLCRLPRLMAQSTA